MYLATNAAHIDIGTYPEVFPQEVRRLVDERHCDDRITRIAECLNAYIGTEYIR
jgi:hypothetical protein